MGLGGQEEESGLSARLATEPAIVALADALGVTPEKAIRLAQAQEHVLRVFTQNYGIEMSRFEALVWADMLAVFVADQEPLPSREEIQKLFPGTFTDWRNDDDDDW